MPALAGVVLRDHAAAGTTVERMLGAAHHRGHSRAIVTVGGAALGVADASEGRQSSIGVEDGVIGAVVGRLDNRAELDAELVRRGKGPRTDTAASTIIAAFGAFGDDAPNHMRGEFAAAVGDGGGIRCWRDHLGFRALFHRRDHDGAYVASEAKQVAAGAGIAPEPDLDIVAEIVFGGLADETATALRGVRRLPKATTLTLGVDGETTTRYWHPEALLETARYGPAELQERFDHLMAQAAARMVTPTTVVSLSGGIDSPAVAAYAAPRFRALTDQPMVGISRTYPEHPKVDERGYVELVAAALGMDLVTYVHRSRHLDQLREWMHLLDGPVPFWSGSDVEANLAEARSLGADTVLTGELAEFVMDAGEHLDSYLLAHGRLGALARRARARRAAGQPWPVVVRRALAPFVPRAVSTAMAHRRGPKLARPLPSWLDQRRVETVPGHLAHRVGDRWRWNQLRAFDGAGLSVEGEEIRQDTLGVRVRMPWADVDLWELFLSLPAEVKYPGIPHKALARDLLRGRVPDEILDRTDKTTFNDAVLADVDYGAMRHWIAERDVDLPGVDYRRLEAELADGDLDLAGYVWARDLCVAHAWLSSWTAADPVALPVGAVGA